MVIETDEYIFLEDEANFKFKFYKASNILSVSLKDGDDYRRTYGFDLTPIKSYYIDSPNYYKQMEIYLEGIQRYSEDFTNFVISFDYNKETTKQVNEFLFKAYHYIKTNQLIKNF